MESSLHTLAADVGGTNARFAIAERMSGAVRIVFQRTYPTKSFPDFEPALEAFLREARAAGALGSDPPHAAIAIAGAVDRHVGRLTNRSNWTIDLRELGEHLGVNARLINDFVALAHAVPRAHPGDWIELQAGEPAPGGTIVLVGAGTGLGVASLVCEDGRYRPQASEGGHVAFAPVDESQLELCRYMMATHGGRASAERVVSGAGLKRIHAFLRENGAATEPVLEPHAITARALEDRASLAATALGIFIRCYGSFAGDMALTFLARGGVYICGGIAAKLAPRFAEGDFIEAFNYKGRHRDIAASIPVRLVTNESLGLLGAALAAFEQADALSR
ncbi:MAG TPA: glucokinase [Burkholderiales bacterium]|nr:glucokinase [Burkholderiales bacterium]